jgi:hypothetical protein
MDSTLNLWNALRIFIVRREGPTCSLLTMNVVTKTETLDMILDVSIDKIVALETNITL